MRYSPLPQQSRAAVEQVLAEGGSPREQLQAAKDAAKESGDYGHGLTYRAHIGKRERERAQRRFGKNT